MELVKGRPESNEGRLDKEIRTYDLLDSLGVEYWRVDHEEATNMEVCEEIDRVLGAQICKNLFLCNRQKTNFYLLMIPGDKVFKTKVPRNVRISEAPSHGKPVMYYDKASKGSEAYELVCHELLGEPLELPQKKKIFSFKKHKKGKRSS